MSGPAQQTSRDFQMADEKGGRLADDGRLVQRETGFWQVADIPSGEELKSYYERRYYQESQGHYSPSYTPEEREYFDILIARNAHLVAKIRGPGAGSMLDVGCGEGFAMDWFRRAGWSVEGLDHSSAGIGALHPHLVPHASFGDVFDLLADRIAEGRTYDLVWLTNVLEHVTDPVQLLASLRNLVAENGVLLITVPNDGSDFQEMLLETDRIPHRFWIALPDHLAYFDDESLRRTAAATGWDCREVIADFPIDFFLLHEGSNYVRDSANGPAAHRARVQMERLLAGRSEAAVHAFYSAMAAVGLGRTLTAAMTRAA